MRPGDLYAPWPMLLTDAKTFGADPRLRRDRGGLGLDHDGRTGEHEPVGAGRTAIRGSDAANVSPRRLSNAVFQRRPPIREADPLLLDAGAGVRDPRSDRDGGTTAGALCTLGVLLLTFSIGERLFTLRAGYVGALILATTFRFAVWSRQGLTDVPVLFFMVAALSWWAKLVPVGTVPPKKAQLLPWIALGLGALTKGPVGVLPLVVIGGYVIVTRQWHLIRQLRILPGVLLAAAIVLPWYAWMAWLHGRAFLDFALGYEVVARYGSTTFPSFPRGFLWYFQIYPGDAAPWTLFIIAAVGWTLWRLRSFDLATRHAVTFLLTWFFAVLIVFSTAKFKVTHYILPAYPAASLLAGVLLDRLFPPNSGAPVSLWRLPFALTTTVVAGLAIVLAVFMHRVFRMPWLDPGMLLPLALGGAAIAMIGFALRRQREQAAMSLVGDCPWRWRFSPSTSPLASCSGISRYARSVSGLRRSAARMPTSASPGAWAAPG